MKYSLKKEEYDEALVRSWTVKDTFPHRSTFERISKEFKSISQTVRIQILYMIYMCSPKGVNPSIIMSTLGLKSKTNLSEHLNKLRNSGYIKIIDSKDNRRQYYVIIKR